MSKEYDQSLKHAAGFDVLMRDLADNYAVKYCRNTMQTLIAAVTSHHGSISQRRFGMMTLPFTRAANIIRRNPPPPGPSPRP